jgi:hypothetical protein
VVRRVSTSPTAVGEPDLLDIILELNGREALHGSAGSLERSQGKYDPVRGFFGVTTAIIIV